jgi:hypothetical protein
MPSPLKLYQKYMATQTTEASPLKLFQWTAFGKVRFDNKLFDHDVVVSEGNARKRFYEIAQAVYGNNHQVGVEELEASLADKTQLFVLGTGQNDIARITPEGKSYLKQHKVKFLELPSTEAVKFYNETVSAKGRKPRITALIHVTC